MRKSIVQFLDVFKNVKIERKDRNGNTTGYIKVPMKFTTKEKVWYWITKNERKNDEILPMMSVNLESVEYDSQRQTSRVHSIIKSKNYDTNSLSQFINPVPYNLGFNMNIWSLHMIDVDQILEQILPWFNPAIFIRIYIPELDATFDLKVMFQGCSPDVTLELQDNEARVVKWTLTFMVQTYLLQPLESVDIINKVIQKIYTNENAWNRRFTESEYTSGAPVSYEDESLFTRSDTPYYGIDNWEADTYYDVGECVLPTTKNGYLYTVDSLNLPGKSGITEPVWSTEKNVPIVDNNLVWFRYQQDYSKRIVEFDIFNNKE